MINNVGKRRHRWAATAMVAALAGVSVAACSSASAGAGSGKEPQSITFAYSNSSGTEHYYQNAAAAYEKAHPGVTITFQQLPRRATLRRSPPGSRAATHRTSSWPIGLRPDGLDSALRQGRTAAAADRSRLEGGSRAGRPEPVRAQRPDLRGLARQRRQRHRVQRPAGQGGRGHPHGFVDVLRRHAGLRGRQVEGEVAVRAGRLGRPEYRDPGPGDRDLRRLRAGPELGRAARCGQGEVRHHSRLDHHPELHRPAVQGRLLPARGPGRGFRCPHQRRQPGTAVRVLRPRVARPSTST